LKKGKILTDAMIVDLVEKRVAMPDCQKYGWIFDGFPHNR
jgi:adenylate kinase family enzyme